MAVDAQPVLEQAAWATGPLLHAVGCEGLNGSRFGGADDYDAGDTDGGPLPPTEATGGGLRRQVTQDRGLADGGNATQDDEKSEDPTAATAVACDEAVPMDAVNSESQFIAA